MKGLKRRRRKAKEGKWEGEKERKERNYIIKKESEKRKTARNLNLTTLITLGFCDKV